MSRQSMIQTVCIFLTMVVVTALYSRAGPITPPPGPVGDTQAALQFKTLQQVEPRTPLSLTTTPGDGTSVFKIVNPGSYYLTGNMSVSATNIGIHVAANHVTLDLSGYSIARTSVGTGSAIRVAGVGPIEATIRNGKIQGWQIGIEATGNDLAGEDLDIRNTGIGIDCGAGAIRKCSIEGSGTGTGISGMQRGMIDSCQVRFCATGINCTSARVTQCVVMNCGTIGIRVFSNSVVSECVISDGSSPTAAGIYCDFTRNRIEDNTCRTLGIGIKVEGDEVGNMIARNFLANNNVDIEADAGNLVGPLVDFVGMAANCNPSANYSVD